MRSARWGGLLVAAALAAACGGGRPQPTPPPDTGSTAPTGPTPTPPTTPTPPPTPTPTPPPPTTAPTTATPAACDGLLPDAPGPGVAYTVQTPAGPGGGCGPALTDGRGEWIGVILGGLKSFRWQFVSAASGTLASTITLRDAAAGRGPGIAPQPDGYHVLYRDLDYLPGALRRYDAQGNLLSDGGGHDVWGVYGLPGGGSVLTLVGPTAGDGAPHLVWIDSDGARRADVAGPAPVAVTSTGDLLAIQDGRLRWYDRSGAAVTDAFDDPAFLALWQHPTFATSRTDALADGSLAFALGTDQALRLAARATRSAAAPDWLAARASAAIGVVRGGRANAFATATPGAAGCDVAIELVTPDGQLCGTVHLAAPAPCGDVTFGPEGTVFMEAGTASPDQLALTCSWRWWSGLLR